MPFLMLMDLWWIPKKLVVCINVYVHIHIYIMSFLFFFSEQPANNQGQSTLQPLPPSHKQHSAQHHPSITSLNRNSLTNRRNQSPAPPAALPAELQTTPESVQLQDSWVLGSNVPLESRWVPKGRLVEDLTVRTTQCTCVENACLTAVNKLYFFSIWNGKISWSNPFLSKRDLLFLKIGVQLLYSTVLASAEWSPSGIRVCMYVSPPWWAFLLPTRTQPARPPQSPKPSSLCCRAGSHLLSGLHTVVYICQSWCPSSSLPRLPPLSPCPFSVSASLYLPCR